MIDADHFKSINDDHGHPVGDLFRNAPRMGQIVRRGDVLCRYGGEEFVVLLPGATKREIATVAERLRIRVEDEPFRNPGSTPNRGHHQREVPWPLLIDSTEPVTSAPPTVRSIKPSEKAGTKGFVVADRMRQQDAA